MYNSTPNFAMNCRLERPWNCCNHQLPQEAH